MIGPVLVTHVEVTLPVKKKEEERCAVAPKITEEIHTKIVSLILAKTLPHVAKMPNARQTGPGQFAVAQEAGLVTHQREADVLITPVLKVLVVPMLTVKIGEDKQYVHAGQIMKAIRLPIVS